MREESWERPSQCVLKIQKEACPGYKLIMRWENMTQKTLLNYFLGFLIHIDFSQEMFN